uniref:Uncharacterized protein n=1 Tax=Arundo donax TaxID=35708 RepID=A0A0A9BCI9_ARUDO
MSFIWLSVTSLCIKKLRFHLALWWFFNSTF